MRKLCAAIAVWCLALPVGAIGIYKIGSGKAVSVGTSATLLDDDSVSDDVDRFIQVCNLEGENPIYIGDATVTTTNGQILPVGYCFDSNVVLNAKAQIYGIASSSTTVRVQESAAR